MNIGVSLFVAVARIWCSLVSVIAGSVVAVIWLLRSFVRIGLTILTIFVLGCLMAV